METTQTILARVDESISVLKSLREEQNNLDGIIQLLYQCLKAGGKLLVCGNGGSAADAEHFVAELVGRFKLERAPLPALALTTNSATITAIANDYNYKEVFARQVTGLANPGDVLIVITTSGNSGNILAALEAAKGNQVKSFGLLGKDGGKAADLCNEKLIVNSADTARIQEAHILIIHIICEILENWMKD